MTEAAKRAGGRRPTTLMRRLVPAALAAMAVLPRPAFAQRPYVQLGGGVGVGAWTLNAPDRGVFPGGAFAFGVQANRVNGRVDFRAFDTDDEHLLAWGVSGGVTWRRPGRPQLYALGGAGFGLFVEEGDPAHHVGAVVGMVVGRRPGVVFEVRYDHLVSEFTYQSRNRNLVSAVVALRLGALGL